MHYTSNTITKFIDIEMPLHASLSLGDNDFCNTQYPIVYVEA